MTQARVLVVGLDGATLDLIEPWVKAGRLPMFTRLMQAGSYGRLRTVPNTDTAPAWTTFATGLNPANHGLFHELGWTSDRSGLRPMRGADRRGVPFWQYASAAGRQVVVINVPFSYPAELVNGYMLAGIDAPSVDAPGFSQPPDFIMACQRANGPYRIDSQITMAIKEGRPEEGLAAAYAVAENHTAALLHALERCSWDVATIVYSIPDEMQHFFWQQMVSGRGPQRQAIYEGYCFIERQIEWLLAHAGPNTTLLLFSDHGFGPICATPERLNGWLEEQGLLRYLPPSAQPLRQRLTRVAYGWLRRALGERQKQALRQWLPSLRDRVESDARFAGIDWSASLAYAGPSPCEIWISTHGREPAGIVAPGEQYQQVREQIIAALQEWRDPTSGRPFLRAIHRREEVYAGRFLAQAPDITLEWDPALAPPAELLPGNTSRFDADHQTEGVLFALGPGIRAGQQIMGAGLADLAPTILQLLDLPLPQEFDGRVLTELFATPAPVAVPAAEVPS